MNQCFVCGFKENKIWEITMEIYCSHDLRLTYIAPYSHTKHAKTLNAAKYMKWSVHTHKNTDNNFHRLTQQYDYDNHCSAKYLPCVLAKCEYNGEEERTNETPCTQHSSNHTQWIAARLHIGWQKCKRISAINGEANECYWKWYSCWQLSLESGCRLNILHWAIRLLALRRYIWSVFHWTVKSNNAWVRRVDDVYCLTCKECGCWLNSLHKTVSCDTGW